MQDGPHELIYLRATLYICNGSVIVVGGGLAGFSAAQTLHGQVRMHHCSISGGAWLFFIYSSTHANATTRRFMGGSSTKMTSHADAASSKHSRKCTDSLRGHQNIGKYPLPIPVCTSIPLRSSCSSPHLHPHMSESTPYMHRPPPT